ncbi:threonyl-tRNA synthetase, putative [Eimeria acervulina]|uniref:threonine--tRNA ligase n=1 Tax=Eimeria acervulina TaxID=5801 RepID=U6GI67_EIMAC|nr:threonyl-tRNA synthetase, putative [Eimeria acervulina]CDI78968.1 threonyl-tRNA synthetase, putative [Eimeria acervulina]
MFEIATPAERRNDPGTGKSYNVNMLQQEGREVPSALCGLLRMREFTQDDGHILCRMSQVLAEVTAFLLACQKLYKAVGFCKGEIVYHISTRPKSSQGSEQEWARAEGLLRSALEQLDIPFTVASGEGAFYGPKIDIHLPDVEGRLWQTGTLQVDMFSPKNFGLEPTAVSNDRMCLLHRAMCGSLERFFGLVLEHLDGHLPSWLAPVQVWY